ncbi:MAG: DUF2628 domain-containing protein [Hungatella sp.]|nr:DUF2628 domain-containing protein [Hungatella sp.]
MTEEQKILDDWSIELFVGNNYEYYKNKWRDKPERQSFSSWNWPAFLFPVYWLAYRKMYLEAFLYVVISLFSVIIPGSGLIIRILVGIFANSYYRKKGMKIIVQTSGMTAGEAEQYISRHGGTSVLSIFVTILISVSLAIAVIAGIAFFSAGEKGESGDLRFASERNQETDNENLTFTTNDLVFSFPNDWKLNEEENPFDLQCFSRFEDLSTGVFVYDNMDLGENASPEDILALQIDNMQSLRENYKFIEETKDAEIGDKRIKTVVYSGEQDGVKNYYVFSLVEFKEFEKFAVILQTCIPSSFEKYKSTLDEIVSSCAPIQ